jgi:hypothetical protein
MEIRNWLFPALVLLALSLSALTAWQSGFGGKGHNRKSPGRANDHERRGGEAA